jgi:hypothetical protein
MNDFVCAVLLLAIGVFLLVSNTIVTGKIVNPPNGGIFVRADVYIRVLGGILAFLSALLLIGSLNFTKSQETTGFKIVLTRINVLTIVGLIFYTLALPLIGFTVSTFLVSFFLVCLYRRGEIGKKISWKDAGIAAIFSVILVLVVYLLFAKVLYVSLPTAAILR